MIEDITLRDFDIMIFRIFVYSKNNLNILLIFALRKKRTTFKKWKLGGRVWLVFSGTTEESSMFHELMPSMQQFTSHRKKV